MKTMTCRDMGGPCDASMSAETPEEMMSMGMQHMHEAHPDMAAKVEAMPKDGPEMMAWNEMFKAKWAAAPMS